MVDGSMLGVADCAADAAGWYSSGGPRVGQIGSEGDGSIVYRSAATSYVSCTNEERWPKDRW